MRYSHHHQPESAEGFRSRPACGVSEANSLIAYLHLSDMDSDQRTPNPMATETFPIARTLTRIPVQIQITKSNYCSTHFKWVR